MPRFSPWPIRNPSGPFEWLAVFVLGLWALPTTLLALVVVAGILLVSLSASKWTVKEGALDVVIRSGWVARLFRRYEWAAFTLGLVVVWWDEQGWLDETSRRHEKLGHVAQNLCLGPLWLPLYLLLYVAGVIWFRSLRDAYTNHPFEKHAYAQEKTN